MSTSTQCLDCKHYTGMSTCNAYPDGIPQEIFDGRVIHTEPYPGDDGVTYDPIDIGSTPDQFADVVTKLADSEEIEKFEIPDEFLEAIDIDPKKMSPDQIKAMFAKLKEKGLLNNKPDDKKSNGGKSTDKGSDDARGSHPGLVKKKVTVRRNGKTSEEYRWVKSGEDEPTEKPKRGDEATGEDAGEGTGEVPGKPKGPAIRGLNKPDGEDDEPEDIKGKEFMDWQSGDEIPGGIKVGSKVDIGKFGIHTVKDITGGVIIGEDDKPYAITSIEEVLDVGDKADEKVVPVKDKPKDDKEKPEKFEMSEHKLVNGLDAMEAGLPESAHGFDITLCEFEGGHKGIYKHTDDEMDVVGETGYHDLAETVGWDVVPQTESVDLGFGPGSCQAFIKGKHPKSADSDDGVVKVTEEHFEDIAQIFAMDIMVGNTDRHDENMMIDETGKVWAIDNDMWTGNVGGYDEDTIDEAFMALDYYCGKDASPGEEGFNKTCRFLSYSLDETGFKKFRSVLNVKLEEIVKHEKTAKEYYAMDGGERHTNYISSNVKSIKKYLSGEK